MSRPKPPRVARKVVQIIQSGATVAALADDGTIWLFDITEREWVQFPSLPA